MDGFFIKIIWRSCLDQVGRNQPGTNRALATNRVTGYLTGPGFFLVARPWAVMDLGGVDLLEMYLKLMYLGVPRPLWVHY